MAYQPHPVLENVTLPTALTTSATRTPTVRQSPVIDSHQLDQPDASYAPCTRVAPAKQPCAQRICQQILSGTSKPLATYKAPEKLTAISECQSPVIDTPL